MTHNPSRDEKINRLVVSMRKSLIDVGLKLDGKTDESVQFHHWILAHLTLELSPVSHDAVLPYTEEFKVHVLDPINNTFKKDKEATRHTLALLMRVYSEVLANMHTR